WQMNYASKRDDASNPHSESSCYSKNGFVPYAVMSFLMTYFVAAHVKPRGKCNYAERRDLSNSVLMCKLGCDPLFERGYIVVKEGEIRVGKRSNLQPAPEYIQRLVGSTTPEYRAANAKYFAWKTKSVD